MDTNQSKRPGAFALSGLTMGIIIGVVLSLVLDSWAWMGAGVGIGLVMGGMPLFGRRSDGEKKMSS